MLIESIAISSIVCMTEFKLEEVLPENAILVYSVHDINKASNNLKALEVCDPILRSISDMPILSELFAATEDECPEMPNTYGAFGIYPVVNYETGSVDIGALGVIELGDSDWGDIFQSSIAKMIQDPELDGEEINLAGRTVSMFSFKNEFIDEAVGLAASYGVQFEGFDRAYADVSNGYFIICTEPDGIASVFNRIDGEAQEKTMAENDTFVLSTQGLDSKSNWQSVLLLENLMDTILQMDGSNTAMLMAPMLKSMFGDVDAVSMFWDCLPSEDEILRVKYRIQMNDGRGGLLGLLSNSGIGQSELPAFVESDLLYCFSLGFDWSSLPRLFQEIATNNPMVAMQMGDELDNYINKMEDFVEPLDGKLIFVSAGMQPSDDQNATGDLTNAEPWNHDAGITRLLAVPCNNERQCVNVLSMMLLDAEAEPREFLDHKIFTLDLFGGMMMAPMESSMSCAVAGGYLIAGSTSHIEHAIRKISDSAPASAPDLDATGIRRISSADANGWGYGDIAKSTEIKMMWAEKELEDVLADLEAFDPEMAAEFREDFEDEQSTFWDSGYSIMENLFGPMAWSVNVDEQGFSSEAVFLKSQ